MKKSHIIIFLFFFPVKILLFAQSVSFTDDDARMRGYYNRPYKRYEAEPGKCGTNGIFLSPSYDQSTLQSEASNQIAVQLVEKSSYVEWTVDAAVNGLTIRFSLPDGVDGAGTAGNFAIFIDGGYSQNITLNSYWAWQYFPKTGTKTVDNQPTDSKFARMKFDEMHLKLKKEIQAGSKIKFVKLDNNTTAYTIDFVELEKIPEIVTFESLQDASKIMYDSSEDLSVFVSNNGGKTIYIPEGKYNVGDRIFITKDGTKIIGAGMWYTELYFSASSDNLSTYFKRGIETDCSDVLVEGLFLNTVNNKRYYNNNDAYQVGKGFNGGFGSNSVIRNVWVEHFECGAWIANYKKQVTDNLLVEHCRFRNNYADGLNLCNGLKNAVVQYCSFRNNGDDDMASWSVDEMCENNTYRYNIAENNWRASSLGFFGGKQNVAHHCVIIDPMEAGIRATCDFYGTGFSSEGYSTFRDISLYRSGVAKGTPGVSGDLWGNHQGAIQLYSSQQYDLTNFNISDIDIYDSKNDAILIASYQKRFNNLVFRNINIDKTGRYGIYYYQPNGNASYCNIIYRNIGAGVDINYTPNNLFIFTEDCSVIPDATSISQNRTSNSKVSILNKTVTISGIENFTISIYDLTGIKKYASTIPSDFFLIPGLETGVYLVEIEPSGEMIKIIIN